MRIAGQFVQNENTRPPFDENKPFEDSVDLEQPDMSTFVLSLVLQTPKRLSDPGR